MDSTENEVFRAAIRGDREAFEMIIRRQSRALFGIAYGVLQNREEAEDVVQDSLLKAWKTRGRLREPEKFPAWLGTIARHRAHDLLRRRRELPLKENAPSWSDSTSSLPNDAVDRHAQVQAALSELPELHRAALTLRYFEAMDYATIERTLGLTNGALRGILGRALSSMRKRLRPTSAALE